MNSKVCKTCGIEKNVDSFHSAGYNSLKDGTRSKVFRSSCKDCANVKLKVAFEEKLQKANIVWKCVSCGYDKCRDALDFHHLDPDEKDFALSDARTYSIEKIINELSKGVILCAVCHREVHAGIRHV